MHCVKCGLANPEGVKFCIGCGVPFQHRCPSCGVENLPQARFCGECGTSLTTGQKGKRQKAKKPSRVQSLESRVKKSSEFGVWSSESKPIAYTPRHLAERILAEQAAMEARGAIDGERRIITALFSDIQDSTAMIEDLDPEEARRIIDPALQLMIDAVHRYEGFVTQSLGDGIFALFGAPIAHEDHPQRALYAALRMQEESKQYAEQLRREQGINLQIRVGINTGEVVLRSIHKDDLHTDYLPIGHSTHIASRMESLASGGGIVVSDRTHRLTEGYFEFKPLGEAKVKGVTEPISIYEVLGVGPLRTRLQVAARRGLVRFVGRQSELEHLQKALEQAKAGHGQIVGVMSEPGVGKSRLFYEFKLLSQKGCLVLETFSVSHGKAYAYLPLIELLKNYFQIALHDDERKMREKIAGKVLILDHTQEGTLPYLFSLLGTAEPTSPLQQMDPQIRKRRTFDAIKRLLVRESRNQPLILIFEDLHWLDSETQAFLTLLSDSVASARMLLLVNYRPEYRHDWGSKTFYTQLRLDPLGQAEAEEMLTVLLGDQVGAQHAAPLRQFILEKTERNPFFMEEIVQALFEEGVLVRESGGGAPRQVKPLTDLQLPTTVQGVLTARIDRLPAEEKAVLQTLSVIGKEFPFSLLKHVVAQSEDNLQPLLSHLQEAEFIYERPAFPEVEYTFKHALTQEVAYNSLMQDRRKVLHEQTAQAIEELFPSRLEDHYGDLAHHYSRSGNTPKAVDFLHRAGQQAVQRSANAEAITHLTTALELLNALPDTPERAQHELGLHLTLGPVLMNIRGMAAPEVGALYTRARELCQQGGDTSQLFPVLYGLWRFSLLRAELPLARELGGQLLRLAQQAQDAPLLLAAHRALGTTLLRQGELPLAREHLEQGIALYDPQQHRSLAFIYGMDTGMTCRIYGAWVLWLLGYPDQALQRSHEAITLAQELSHPYSLSFALEFTAHLHQLRREWRLAQERAEAAIALSAEQGFALDLSQAAILRGWALAEQGQGKDGIAQIRQGLAAWRAMGAKLTEPYFLILLAEAYGTGGQVEEGLSVVAEALAAVDKAGERLWEAELYRLYGELSLRIGETETGRTGDKKTLSDSPILRFPDSSPEACFKKAIEIARKQQAKSLELRAVMSLSRLWQQQGKQDEARQMLAEIYGWFTEGFDTKDLQEAKALLDEWA